MWRYHIDLVLWKTMGVFFLKLKEMQSSFDAPEFGSSCISSQGWQYLRMPNEAFGTIFYDEISQVIYWYFE